MNSLREFCIFGGWFLGLGAVAGFVLRWWSGDHFLVVRLVNYLMPWLLIPLITMVVGALVLQRHFLSLVLAGVALAIVVTYAPLFSPAWPNRAAVPSSAAAVALKVMSYNVWSENIRMGEMTRVIRENRPDILLLQEIRPERFASLRDSLVDLWPGHLHSAYDAQLLQGVISHFPIFPLKALKQLGQAQKVAIETPFGEITVFNVHPLRRGGWQRRYKQIAALLEEEILGSPGPVILGGDFNTTDQTQLYRRLTRHLRNAHWEAGFGFGFTYPSIQVMGLPLPPIVRIDHIFYNRHFQALSAATVKDSGGSDHYPVIAELAFRHTSD